MDILSNLKYAPGSKKAKKRVGRGEGSGHGGQATRGMNGQMSRSGASHKAWFEGGQIPLQRRLPKVGFKSPFKINFQVVNVASLQKAVDNGQLKDSVTIESLHKAGLISSSKKPVKVLGDGNLSAKLSVEVNSISESAKNKIETAGGSVKTL